MAALTVDIETKAFPALGRAPVREVLDRVRLEVASGETVAIIGPSGCGKTTLLNLIAGLDRGFTGRIERGPDTRLAYVFQEPTLLPWRTVEQNVRLALPKDRRDADLDWLFRDLGLAGMRSLYPSELSLGLARRAALARAFAVEPTMLFLDEPFVSLDEQTAARLRHLLLSIWSARPTTALMVTHNLREALMLSDRIVVLSPRPAHVLGLFDVRLPRQYRNPQVMSDLLRSFQQKFPDLK
jgi:NitT/TauT family transport system ATP-binding protein